jgi:hypothetical protein
VIQHKVMALEPRRHVDLGGYRVQLSPKDHHGSSDLDLTFVGTQRWES